MSDPKSAAWTAALARIDARLPSVTEGRGFPPKLREACDYALLGGGKRIRPVLTLLADAALGNGAPPSDACLATALALELIHTYSLVHDDLPAMDDDDLRRGRPTVHVKFDEATAILAGDALLTLAFELAAETPGVNAAAIRRLALAAGGAGMVGGQSLDLEAETKRVPLEQLRVIHAGKTGALLEAAAVLPALLRQDETAAAALGVYGRSLGLAFQIADDILDATSDSATLGKTAGSDAANGKSTYVTVLGLDEAKRQLDDALRSAVAAAETVEGKDGELARLARFVADRKN